MSQLPETSLSHVVDDLDAFAAAATERFGVRTVSPPVLLSYRENAVFRVDDASTGGRYVIRAHRPRYQTERSIRSELAWMQALRQSGVDTPAAVAGTDGDLVQAVALDGWREPLYCDMMHWIEGVPPAADNAGGDLAETYHLVGSINARMHRHVRAWETPPGFERHAWDEDGMFGDAPLWGRFGDLEALTGNQVALLSEACDATRARVVAFGKAPDRFGLIHADMLPENILVTSGGPQVIDFDDCGFGWFLYDFATCVSFHEGKDSFATVHDAWIGGYRGVAPLPDEFLEESLTFRLARFIVILGWLHGRRDTSFAKAHTPWAVATACGLAREFLGR